MSSTRTAIQCVLVIASLLATAGAAQAQAQSAGYVQLGAGRSDLNLDCTGSINCDSSGNAYQLIGGWRFGSNFAAEVLYTNFGKATQTERVGTIDVRVEGKATVLGVGGAFTPDFGNGFGGVARLGVGRVNAKVNGSGGGVSVSASDNATGVYAGLGLTYAFSKSIAGEVGYLRARAKFDGESGTVSAFTLGLRFDF